MNVDRFVNLECVVCLIVGDGTRRATPARTVLGGHAVCLDHATALIEDGRSEAVRLLALIAQKEMNQR